MIVEEHLERLYARQLVMDDEYFRLLGAMDDNEYMIDLYECFLDNGIELSNN